MESVSTPPRYYEVRLRLHAEAAAVAITSGLAQAVVQNPDVKVRNYDGDAATAEQATDFLLVAMLLLAIKEPLTAFTADIAKGRRSMPLPMMEFDVSSDEGGEFTAEFRRMGDAYSDDAAPPTVKVQEHATKPAITTDAANESFTLVFHPDAVDPAEMIALARQGHRVVLQSKVTLASPTPVSHLYGDEAEWLQYAIDHMRDDSEPEDKACAIVLQGLLNRVTAAGGGHCPKCNFTMSGLVRCMNCPNEAEPLYVQIGEVYANKQNEGELGIGWTIEDPDDYQPGTPVFARTTAPAAQVAETRLSDSEQASVDRWRVVGRWQAEGANGHDMVANRNTVCQLVSIIDKLAAAPAVVVDEAMAERLVRTLWPNKIRPDGISKGVLLRAKIALAAALKGDAS